MSTTPDSRLEGSFKIQFNSTTLPKATITLSDNRISINDTDVPPQDCFRRTKVKTELHCKDVVGCKVVGGNSFQDCDNKELVKGPYYFVVVYVYETESVNNSRNLKLKRYRFYHFLMQMDSLPEAQRWCSEILNKQNAIRLYQSASASLLDSSKKVLVFVNPMSGQKKALQIFQDQVMPMLSQGALDFHLVVTERANHARDFVATEDISGWSCICIVSGDGLFNEVVNGLFERSDWEAATQTIPLAIVPGGSGNGLARSIAYANRERYDNNGVLLSALNLVQGFVRPLDLMCIQSKAGWTRYGTLSVGWGLLADIDIESERLRFIGEPRFALWTVVRVAKLRLYPGRLSYLPATNKMTKETTMPSTHVPCKETDRTLHVPELRHPPLSDPVPSDWRTIEDSFVLVYCVNQPYIGSTLLFAPESRHDDGILWLCVIRQNISRSGIVSFLMGLESGEHVSVDGVMMIPVRAFRLEPLQGKVVVDGELMDSDAVQVEVLPSYLKLVSK